MVDNIFEHLSRFGHRQDENYLTECFVFVLNFLLEYDKPLCLRLLELLCVKDKDFSFAPDEEISIETQERTKEGIPDIKITSPEKLIYIEVKLGSGLRDRQISDYKKILKNSKKKIKKVNLLSRFPIETNAEKERPYKKSYWYEIYNGLSNMSSNNEAVEYFINKFKEYMEVEGLSTEKVKWEYIDGIPAFFNLIQMCENGLTEKGFEDLKYSAGQEWYGIKFDNNDFWVGIVYDNHLEILLDAEKKEYNYNLNVRSKELSYEFDNEDNRPHYWLNLEKIHFFSLNKDEQQEKITTFIKECYADCKRMME